MMSMGRVEPVCAWRRTAVIFFSPALKVSAEEAERYLDEALAKGVLKPAKEAAKKKA